MSIQNDVDRLDQNAENRDSKYRQYMERKGLSSLYGYAIGGGVIGNPFKALLINGLILLVLFPAIICITVGTIFKLNFAYMLMAVYAGLVILSFIAVLLYAIVNAVRKFTGRSN